MRRPMVQGYWHSPARPRYRDIGCEGIGLKNTPGRCGNTFRDEDCFIKEIFEKRYLCGLYWSDIVIHLLFDNCDAKVMIISMTVSILATANKERRALVVKPAFSPNSYGADPQLPGAGHFH